jgi:hypothetical protein
MSGSSFPLRAAIIGFCVGIALCGYTFYLTSHHEIGSPFFFLVLCPPSIAAIALDNAGVVGGLIGWLFISFANAGFYSFVWAIFRSIDNSSPK